MEAAAKRFDGRTIDLARELESVSLNVSNQ